MGCHQYTTGSNPTTLESNKSEDGLQKVIETSAERERRLSNMNELRGPAAKTVTAQ